MSRAPATNPLQTPDPLKASPEGSPSRITLENVSVEPSPFSPGIPDGVKDSTTLSFDALVRPPKGLTGDERDEDENEDADEEEDGKRAHAERYLVRWRWSMVLSGQDSVVILGEREIRPPLAIINRPISRRRSIRYAVLKASSSWDGRERLGSVVPNGAYEYRVEARYVRVREFRGRHRKERTLGTAATVRGSLAINNTAPTVEITGFPDGLITSNDVTVGVRVTPSDGVATMSCSYQRGTDPLQGFAAPKTFGLEGRYTIRCEAVDNAGNRGAAEAVFVLDKSPPVISITAPPSDASVLNVRSPRIAVSYFDDLSGVNLDSFSATLDGTQDISDLFVRFPSDASADLTDHIELTDGTHELHISVANGAGLVPSVPVRRTFAVSVAGGVAALRGQLLDAFTDHPVVNARLFFRDHENQAVRSGADGHFELVNLPTGNQMLMVRGSEAEPTPEGRYYADYSRPFTLVPGQIVKIDRPIYLPPVDLTGAVTIDSSMVDASGYLMHDCIVDNANIGVRLTLREGTLVTFADGRHVGGTVSVSEVPKTRAPAQLPPTVDPSILITFQPSGIKLDRPTGISFPNRDRWAPGNEANLLSFNHDRGVFEVIGPLVTGPDGIAGNGPQYGGWHCPCPPTAGGDPPFEPPQPPECPENPIVNLVDASFRELVDLPSYRTLEVDRRLKLEYRSQSARPFPVVSRTMVIPVRAAVPSLFSAEVQIQGASAGPPIYFDTGSLPEESERPFQVAYGFDAATLLTGTYDYGMTMTSLYPQSRARFTSSGRLRIINDRLSPFGAGWRIAGIPRLIPRSPDVADLVDGKGTLRRYVRSSSAGSLFGNGADGDLAVTNQSMEINASTVLATTAGAGSDSLLVSSTQGFNPLDEVVVLALQGASAGKYEFARVSAIGANRIRLVGRLANTYPAAAGGQTGIVARVPNYRSIEIGSNGVLTGTQWNGAGGGVVVLRVSERLRLQDGGRLDISGRGFRGGGRPGGTTSCSQAGGQQGESVLGTGRIGDSRPNGGGGGGGGPDACIGCGGDSPAGGGGYGTAGTDAINPSDPSTAGRGGQTYGEEALENAIFLGSGGGESHFYGNPGGAGGGLVIVFAKELVVESGAIDANGASGSRCPGGHPSGGGSGGSILLVGETISISPTAAVRALGGSGFGVCECEGETGGGGGSGRIRVLSPAFVGTSNPPASVVAHIPEPPVAGVTFLSEPGDVSTLADLPSGGWERRLKYGLREAYDAAGRLVVHRDAFGNATRYSYDADGRLVSITDPVGAVTSIEYAGELASAMIDPVGRRVTLTHDADRNLIAVGYPGGSVRRYRYGTDHQLLEAEDTRGNKTQITPSVPGHLAALRYPDAATVKYFPTRLEAFRNPASGTDPPGSAARPYRAVTQSDQLTTYEDARGGVTTLVFTPSGEWRITDAAGHSWVQRRGDATEVLEETRPDGGRSIYGYDRRFNPTDLRLESHLPGEVARHFQTTYDTTFDQPTSFRDPLNNTTLVGLDPVSGARISQTDALGRTWRYQYNQFGQLTDSVDPLGNTEHFVYDPLRGNLVSSHDASGRTFSFAYDAAGNRIHATDPSGATTTYSYSPMNLLTGVTDASGVTTRFRYDSEGNLLETADGRDRSTSYDYDSRNRVVAFADPAGGRETMTYDAAGNLVSRLTRRGQAISYAYDAVDRLVRKTVGTSTDTYEYDAVGNLTRAVNDVSNINYAYNGFDQVVAAVTSLAGVAGNATVAYSYDARGLRASLRDGTGEDRYAYDANGALEQLTPSFSPSVDFAHDARGRTTAIQFPNGVTGSFVWDARGRMSSVEYRGPTGSLLAETYTYDGTGKLTAIADALGVHGFQYDAVGRLTDERHPAGSPLSSRPYAYDQSDNRLDPGAAFGASNELLTVGAKTFTYDGAGNVGMESDATNGRLRRFEYDAEDRLVAVFERPGGALERMIARYQYDALGRRVIKIVATDTVQFGYDLQNILRVRRGSGGAEQRFVLGPGWDSPIAASDGLRSIYFHVDRLQSVRAISGSDGSVAASFTRDAWGVPAQSENDGTFSYTGRELDAETGIYHLRRRAYAPQLGRFLQQDPYALRSSPIAPHARHPIGRFVNPYTYAQDSPLEFRDASGQFVVQCLAAVFVFAWAWSSLGPVFFPEPEPLPRPPCPEKACWEQGPDDGTKPPHEGDEPAEPYDPGLSPPIRGPRVPDPGPGPGRPQVPGRNPFPVRPPGGGVFPRLGGR